MDKRKVYCKFDSDKIAYNIITVFILNSRSI